MRSARPLAAALHERAEALARFEAWEAAHPNRLSPAAALEAIGALCDLLPPAARLRPVDPAGVIVLHETLGLLA